MHSKFSFNLSSDEHTRKLPGKIIIGQNDTETTTHVLLKLMGYLLFFRERLQLETRIPNDNIPFVPDLAELDYELRPTLWIECGECSIAKLQKLAVKAPEAEIWVIKSSASAVDDLLKTMGREQFRKGRYHLIGLQQEMFDEMLGLMQSRNKVYLLKLEFEPGEIQFEFNGLWFEMPFVVRHF